MSKKEEPKLTPTAPKPEYKSNVMGGEIKGQMPKMQNPPPPPLPPKKE